MPVTKETRVRNAFDDVASVVLASARHVKGCRLTQGRRVQDAFDDVASTICKSLQKGPSPVDPAMTYLAVPVVLPEDCPLKAHGSCWAVVMLAIPADMPSDKQEAVRRDGRALAEGLSSLVTRFMRSELQAGTDNRPLVTSAKRFLGIGSAFSGYLGGASEVSGAVHGCVGCAFVSETAQVEVRSVRV